MATSGPRFFVSAEQRRRDRPTEWGRLAVPGVRPALRPLSQEKVPYYVMQLTVSFSRWKPLPNLLFRGSVATWQSRPEHGDRYHLMLMVPVLTVPARAGTTVAQSVR